MVLERDLPATHRKAYQRPGWRRPEASGGSGHIPVTPFLRTWLKGSMRVLLATLLGAASSAAFDFARVQSE
jgi:hypothetical protein